MSKGKPKDTLVPPGDEDDGLATAEDLFGHLVDAPPPQATGKKNARSAPVRVKLSDPVSPEPLTPVEPEDEAIEPPHAPVLEEAAFRRMTPAPPFEDDEEARVPPAHERTGAKFTVTPDDTLLTAYSRMKLYEVSQIPVVDDDHIVGIVDESDIMLAVYDHEGRFGDPVHESMSAKLETVAPSTPLAALLPIFDKGCVALVRDRDEYLGLITRIDLLNHLRRRMR